MSMVRMPYCSIPVQWHWSSCHCATALWTLTDLYSALWSIILKSHSIPSHIMVFIYKRTEGTSNKYIFICLEQNWSVLSPAKTNIGCFLWISKHRSAVVKVLWVLFTVAYLFRVCNLFASLDDIVAQGFEMYIYSLPCENLIWSLK